MNSLLIQIICPAKPGSRQGNRVTALRWQRLLRQLGHRVQIQSELRNRCDLLVALHAKRSAAAIRQSQATHPARPVVVAITGTDIYRDGKDSVTQSSLRVADRIVVLQAKALDALTPGQRKKARVIHQSAKPLQISPPRQPRRLRVCVAGHLRALKDPFRAAYAVRSLPSDSRIEVHHFGGVIEERLRVVAEAETLENSRYTWHGEISRSSLRKRLARSWLVVLSSKMEGGANLLTEAIVNGIPVLASEIPGSIGLLGKTYSGYFPVGSTRGLRNLLLQSEHDTRFYESLCRQVRSRAPRFEPAREQSAWAKLIGELH